VVVYVRDCEHTGSERDLLARLSVGGATAIPPLLLVADRVSNPEAVQQLGMGIVRRHMAANARSHELRIRPENSDIMEKRCSYRDIRLSSWYAQLERKAVRQIRHSAGVARTLPGQ